MKEGKGKTAQNSTVNNPSRKGPLRLMFSLKSANGWVSDSFTFIANTINSNNARIADHGCLIKSITTPKAQNLH